MKTHLTEHAVSALLKWYGANRRDLPWRHTKDPYCIWISEIMLQQTRVEAVKPYYARYLEVCPNVRALAELEEEKLYKLWEGLGYYSRARNLQKAAKTVLEQYGGRMPSSYRELRTLAGIGDYTAGAIASIAYGERVPAVDGNVLRVLSRVCASYDDIGDPKTKIGFAKELEPIVPFEAGDFTQALIELGATVCVPNGAPKCDACPLHEFCAARAQGLVDVLPIKSPKKPRRIEQKTVFIIRDETRTAICKRPPKGLLAGLYELPNTVGHLTPEESLGFLRKIGFEPIRIERVEDSKHIFTHIEWHMIAYSVRVTPEFDDQRGSSSIRFPERDDLLQNYAVPSAFSAYQKYL